jgi:GntR family transcriptional regulator/MocR family aminotransferase
VEDPGYPPMREAFAATGSEPCPVPVDEEGLNIAAKTDRFHAEGGVSYQEKSDQAPKLVGVTPSHQFPLGVTMSLSRRLDLLEWAAQTQTWIFEDDYDSEYQYSGQPIAALQGLDNGERVIYAGTFSKVLFPALRLGYIVVPLDLVDAFTQMRSLSDRCPPRVQQMALADFMEEGHFDEHIRRMRTLYASRQSILLNAIDQNLSSLIEIVASDAGLHLVGWLPNDVDDQVISERLENAGIVAPPLSYYSQRKMERGGLLLGYASVSEVEILDGVSRMTETLKSF